MAEIITERELMLAIAAHVPEGNYVHGDTETIWITIEAEDMDVHMRVTYRCQDDEDERGACLKWIFNVWAAYAEVLDEFGNTIRVTPPEAVASYLNRKFYNVIYD